MAAIVVREVQEPDDGRPFTERLRVDGVCRYDLRTGRLARADVGFPLPSYRYGLTLAGSADGERVALAWSTISAPTGNGGAPPRSPLTIRTADFHGGAAEELLTLDASFVHDRHNLALQWSPDGRLLALSALTHPQRVGGASPAVTVIDVETGLVQAEAQGFALAGSASWSPRSDRLLTRSWATDVTHIYDIAANSAAPVPGVSDGRMGSAGRPDTMPLGFAGNERLLVAHQRGASLTMTVSTVDVTTGTSEPFLRFAGAPFMYPVIAAMPAEYWD